jgi:hypothetical protein
VRCCEYASTPLTICFSWLAFLMLRSELRMAPTLIVWQYKRIHAAEPEIA